MRVVLLVLAALVLAGCAGQAKPSEVETSTPAEHAKVRGTVLDEVGLPIEGAEAGLVGIANLTALSSPDGRFELDGIAPGVHELVVMRIGYVAAQRPLRLSDGETLELEVTLVAIRRPLEGETLILQGRGFISCSAASSALTPTVTQPCGWDPNNKPLFPFEVDVPRGLVAVVAELDWVPTTGVTGQELRLGLWRNPTCNARCEIEDGTEYGEYANGPSPLKVQVGNLSAPMRAGLYPLKPTPIAAVALVREAHGVASNPADVVVVWQQPVDFHVTVFYNREPLAGYSALAK